MDEKLASDIKSGKVAPKDLPAGAVRTDAKLLAADSLAEKAEKQAGDNFAYDPSKIEIDNEIAQNYNETFNEFEVTDAVDDRAYLWVRDANASVMEVKTRVQRYLGNRVPGFKIVSGKDPECAHLKTPEGYRRIGDCLLFWCPKPVKAALDEKIRDHNRAREMGISTTMLDYAERNKQYVSAREFEGDPHEYYRDRAARGGMSAAQFQVEMARTMAIHKMAEDAKEGKLFGMPVQRAVRR